MNAGTISRRAALTCGAALFATHALAESMCSAGAAGEKNCDAFLDLGASDTVRQQKPHWCWAACIQTIFATHGYTVAQDRIVRKIFGDQSDRSANGPQIMSAIDGDWTADSGTEFQAESILLWDRVASYVAPDAMGRAATELQNGNPLIFASGNHTVVLTAMTYRLDPDGKMAVDSLSVRDPWPYVVNRHDLPITEITRSGFLCGVHVRGLTGAPSSKTVAALGGS